MKAKFIKEYFASIPDQADVLFKVGYAPTVNHDISAIVRHKDDPTKVERVTSVVVEV